jgi:hypothetical protein
MIRAGEPMRRRILYLRCPPAAPTEFARCRYKRVTDRACDERARQAHKSSFGRVAERVIFILDKTFCLVISRFDSSAVCKKITAALASHTS